MKKNDGLNPNNITLGVGKKFWWKYSKGHEWQAIIPNRLKGSGCPYCSGLLAITGYNDLATLYPELIKEWDFEKNVDIQPNEIKAGSGKKVWWKCSNCGYEWLARITDRTRGNDCPKCAKKKK